MAPEDYRHHMPWRQIGSERVHNMTDHALACRRLLRPQHREIQLFDETCWVFRDGWVPSGSPHGRARHEGWVRDYEWGSEHQAAFEAALRNQSFDDALLERAIADLGWHWNKLSTGWAMFGTVRVPWLEPFATGISDTLHELGKTKQFRSLASTNHPTSVSFEVIDGDDGSPDVRTGGYEPERVVVESHARAELIATRGMAEYIGTRFEMEPRPLQPCAICGEKFWIQALDGPDIARFGAPRYCSRCLNAISNRVDPWGIPGLSADEARQGALDSVHLFHQFTGMYPTSSAKKPSIAHAPDDIRDQWVIACMLLPGRETVKKYFGDWRSMLAAADVLDEMPRKGHSGYVSAADDGHVALSNAEHLICNFLYHCGIAHDKEPMYPFDEELNPRTALRADWKVGDQFVEFAGRMGDMGYELNIERKRELARRHGIDLLVLLPTDLRKLELVDERHWS